MTIGGTEGTLYSHRIKSLTGSLWDVLLQIYWRTLGADAELLWPGKRKMLLWTKQVQLLQCSSLE